MRKTLSLVLVLAMILGVFGIVQLSAETVTKSGFEYKVMYDNTVEIVGYEGGKTAITIPETIDGLSVSSIGDYAFTNNYDLAEIVVPDCVENIGVSAFYGTQWYENQKNGVVYAGKVLYSYKGKMADGTKLMVKDGTLSITDKAFQNYTSLKEITFPDSLKSIGSEAFYSCSGLTSVVIPNSVVTIYDEAFNLCKNLEKVTLSKNLKHIGGYAFSNTAIKEITIPESVKTMRNDAFSYCTQLTKVDIKGSLTKIENSAFYNCTALTTISLPSTLEYIGKWAFQDCSSLAEISFPKSLSYVGNVAFDGTKWLKNQGDGMIYINTVLYKYKGEMPKDTVISIGDSTTCISASAFYMCENLKEITIPESISIIEDFAFYSCTSLEKVELPDTIKSIGSEAFCDCSSLSEIVIPSSVDVIKGGAFTYCVKLSDITILNPYCEINPYSAEDSKTIPYITTIHGYSGSTAEALASQFGYTFVSIGEIPTLLGDVDGDNEVSVMDATAIQFRLANLDGFMGSASADEATPDEATKDEIAPDDVKPDLIIKNGDVDRDGVVSIIDATRIQFYLASIIPEL